MSNDHELDVDENGHNNNETNKSLIRSVVSKVKRLLPWFNDSEGGSSEGPRLKRPRLESSPIPGRVVQPSSQEEPSFIAPPTPQHPNFTFSSSINSPTLIYNTRQPPPPPLNGDDQSDHSDGSTSGCSSLYPQGLGKNRRDASVGTETTVSSAFADITSSLRRRPLWSERKSEMRQPQPSPVPSDRPSFNYSLLGPSHVPLRSPSLLASTSTDQKFSSPYYSGATCFGGSSAKKKPISTVIQQPAPYSRPVHQVRVANTPKKNSLEYLSVTARKILKSMETSQLKINDPPAEAPSAPAPLTFNTQKYKKNLCTTPLNTQAPPVANSPHPSLTPARTAYSLQPILDPKKPQKAPEKPTVPKEDLPQQPSSKPTVPPPRSENKSKGGGGGKMRSKISKSHHTSAVRLPQEEPPEELPLPNVALPITSFPKFTFGSSKPSTPATTTSSPLTSTTSDSSSGVKFTFSAPIRRDPAPSTTLGAEPTMESPPIFNFSQPLSVVDPPPSKDPPLEVKATTGGKSDWGDKFKAPANSWSCPVCLIVNKGSDSTCLACTTPKPGAAPAPPKPPATSVGLGDKAPPKNWICDTCLVPNKPSDNKCVACETKRPGCGRDLANDKPPGPQFKFGMDTTTTTPAESFKFGVPSTFTFGTETKQSTSEASTFIFGSEPKQSTTTEAPTFKFGTETKQSTTTEAPAFTFGAEPEQSKTTKAPTFTFGAEPTQSKTTEAPAFKFGVPSSLATNGPNSAVGESGNKSLPSIPVFGVVSSSNESRKPVPNNKHVTFGETTSQSSEDSPSESKQDNSSDSGLSNRILDDKEVPSDCNAKQPPRFSFFSKENAQPSVTTKSLTFGKGNLAASNAVSSSDPKKTDSLPTSSHFTFGAPLIPPSKPPAEKENGPQQNAAATSLAVSTLQPAKEVQPFTFGLTPLKEHQPTTSLTDSNKTFKFDAPAPQQKENPEVLKKDDQPHFRFVQSEKPAPQPSSMFTFGNTAAAPAPSSAPSLFSFGAPATSTTVAAAPATASLFTFGTPASSAPSVAPSGGFSGPTPAPTSAFSFGLPQAVSGSAAPPSSTTFKFGATTNSAAPQFGAPTNPQFGGAANQPPQFGATTNLAPQFGATTNSTTQFGSGAAFTFGGSDSAQANSAQQPAASSVFKFGAPQTTSTQQPFVFGAQPQTGGFNFTPYVGGANPTPTINFGSAAPSPVARPPTFGQPTVHQNSLTPAPGTVFPGQLQPASGLQDALNRPTRRIKKAQRKVTKAT